METPLKTYKSFLSLSVMSSFLFLSGCGASSTIPNSKVSEKKRQICMDTNEPDRVLTTIQNQATSDPNKKLYLLFYGSTCLSCPDLLKKVSNLNLDAEILYLNADFTWMFVLSRHVGVRGLPTLSVFMQGKPRFSREGNASILEYLHGNQRKN